MNQIFLDYTDLVEPASIDESYLDLTGSLHLLGVDANRAADQIRERVRSELGITVSVGGVLLQGVRQTGQRLQNPTPPHTSPGGHAHADLAHAGGQSALCRRQVCPAAPGDGIAPSGIWPTQTRTCCAASSGPGESAWRCANGLDTDPVRPYDAPREVKSIGNSITFRRNLTGERSCGWVHRPGRVGIERMRRQQVCCHTLQIQIRDPISAPSPGRPPPERPLFLARELAEEAMALAAQSWDFAQAGAAAVP